METRRTLGQRLRELREAKDLSLRELAKKLDVSAAFLSDVELGRRFPSADVLAKMAKILEVTTDELKAFDTRPPVEDLKRISASNPTYGFALRQMVEKGVSADELMKFVKQVEQKKKK
jgi:transcriptional regulator with XRE-family HTH domain